MKVTLVIMAAGMGSRFGGGIKQLERVGPNGEILMDYSIHDAIQAGFGRIVFIIRRDIEQAFKQVIGDRVEQQCARMGVDVAYAYQEMTDLPCGFSVPEGRAKPWGTCHAVLACRNVVDGPFAVINADDYYGKETYRAVYRFLSQSDGGRDFCMVGFVLKNTLSDNGGVSRAVCITDEEGQLKRVEETRGIKRVGDKVVSDTGRVLDPEGYISMNIWGVTPQVFPLLQREFEAFLSAPDTDIIKGELVLPVFFNRLLITGEITVKMLPTQDSWMGVTFKEDVPTVKADLNRLIEAGEYNADLFSDLI